MNSWYDDYEEMDYTVIPVFEKKDNKQKNKKIDKNVNNYINFICSLPMEFTPAKRRASIIIETLQELN